VAVAGGLGRSQLVPRGLFVVEELEQLRSGSLVPARRLFRWELDFVDRVLAWLPRDLFGLLELHDLDLVREGHVFDTFFCIFQLAEAGKSDARVTTRVASTVSLFNGSGNLVARFVTARSGRVRGIVAGVHPAGRI